MEVRNGGKIENSYGGISESETWGKRAQWCDYSGPIEGRIVGVSVFDHPESFRYPTYWHYEILMVLKVLAETNKLHDKRCSKGLDILEGKRLPDGGFPKEDKYDQSSNTNSRYFTPGDWNPTSIKKMNEWVTIDALYILKEAKRIDIEY